MGSDRKPIEFELDKLKIRGALSHWFECHVNRCNPSRKTAVKSIDKLFSMVQVNDKGTLSLSSVSPYPFLKIEGGETICHAMSAC